MVLLEVQNLHHGSFTFLTQHRYPTPLKVMGIDGTTRLLLGSFNLEDPSMGQITSGIVVVPPMINFGNPSVKSWVRCDECSVCIERTIIGMGGFIDDVCDSMEPL